MKTWGVMHRSQQTPRLSDVRECDSHEHARSVLRGLPRHYLPAHIVKRHGSGWLPHIETADDHRDNRPCGD